MLDEVRLHQRDAKCAISVVDAFHWRGSCLSSRGRRVHRGRGALDPRARSATVRGRAQRERALYKLFADVTGKIISEGDLVRNLLLGGIADEDDRIDAYEKYWRPIEEANGSGGPTKLEAFLKRFLDEKARPAADATTRAPSLLEGFGHLVRARGGNAGVTGLYDAGTDAANSAPVVAPDAAGKAVLALLQELLQAGTGANGG